MTAFAIRVAASAKDIAACLPVLSELRPQLAADSFVATIQRLMDSTNFALVCLDAHRFYLRKGMMIEAHYFSMNVPTRG